jgi:hypothetical protein
MKHVRMMEIVVNHVKMEEEDGLDALFWLSKTDSERLSEVVRLRKNYFAQADRPFPARIEKVVNQREL